MATQGATPQLQSLELRRPSGSSEFESGGSRHHPPPTHPHTLVQRPGPHLQPECGQLEQGVGRGGRFREVWGALGEDGPPVQRLERKRGKAGAWHRSLTWPPASSVVHACSRSELPGALLRGLGFAGWGES